MYQNMPPERTKSYLENNTIKQIVAHQNAEEKNSSTELTHFV